MIDRVRLFGIAWALLLGIVLGATAQPAPPLSEVKVTAVRSAVSRTWESISPGQTRTTRHHGGAWLEVKTEDIGYGTDRQANVHQRRGQRIATQNVVGPGALIRRPPGPR